MHRSNYGGLAASRELRRSTWQPFRGTLYALALLAPCAGCKLTEVEDAGLYGGLVTAVLTQAPANEIEQTYYLGIFDPHEQVPPSVYRVTVHGQASALSFANFASGWVPAELSDSLGTNFSRNESTGVIQQTGGSNATPELQTGRRLVLFGPEGFRESPKNSRLVIVMGQDPSKYFNAISQGMAEISKVQSESTSSTASQQLLQEYARVSGEQSSLQKLQLQIQLDAAKNQ